MALKGAFLGFGVAVAAVLGFAPAANAITINPASTLEDINLSNNKADGPTYSINNAPYFWGAAFSNDDDGGMAVFKFKNTSAVDQIIAVSLGTVLQGVGGRFLGGVTAKWIGGESVFIPQGQLGTFAISTLLDAGERGRLKIIFGDPVARGLSAPGIQLQIDATPSAVPLPPAALLLLSGLGGMGLLARRRKAAAIQH